MARQTRAQKAIMGRVTHEYKQGELKSGAGGRKVKTPKQAIAIALHEAGATNQESPAANQKALTKTEAKTEAKQAKGETAQAASEGKAAQTRTLKAATSHRRRRPSGPTKRELYAKAKRQKIAGRSKMSKAQLERVLH